MAEKFDATVAALFKGMDGFLSAKTVVGEPITVNDTIMGGKMSPSAVLVIHDGITRLVNVKNQDTVTKLIDMVPEIIEKFKKKKEKLLLKAIRKNLD